MKQRRPQQHARRETDHPVYQTTQAAKRDDCGQGYAKKVRREGSEERVEEGQLDLQRGICGVQHLELRL